MATAQPRKALFIVMDAQFKELAPPSMDDYDLHRRMGGYTPTEADLKPLYEQHARLNATVDALRGHMDIAYVAMMPGQTPLVTQDADAFRAYLENGINSITGLYDVHPQQGDWFVGKTGIDVHRDFSFIKFIISQGYTDIYIAGYQASKCVIASATRYEMPSDLQSLCDGIAIHVVHDLSADTHVGVGVYVPLPPRHHALAAYARYHMNVVSADDVLARHIRPRRIYGHEATRPEAQP